MPKRECHEEVTRKGQAEPCDKVAVAYRIDPEHVGPYPVCVRHTRGEMVPLEALELGWRADGLRAARTLVLNADVHAGAVGHFNGRPIVTAETVRHLAAIDAAIALAAPSDTITGDTA